MSSGSNAPRKPNVAAASTSLFKASSRFLHSGERNGPAGAGGSGKGVKRQRAAAAAGVSFDSAESNNISEVSRCFAVAEHKDSAGGGKSKKRFVGVRQRPSGRWVAEIKDTTQKIRLWLGTFDSAEEGAKAYDSAARALRGANTRTNFVPAMACEGTVPASKAARLIRLRQNAAASKAGEKQAPRNVDPKGADDHPNVKVESPPENPSPLMRQDEQQSISSLDSPAAVDDHTTSLMPSPKPARLLGRRHNAPLASAKLEQEEAFDAPPLNDDGTVIDTGCKAKLEVIPSPPKLEPQLSITSESFSNAISHSLTAGSPQESSSSPGLLRLPSPRSPFECMQATKDATAAGGPVQSANHAFVEATQSHLKSFNSERFTSHRLESLAFPEDHFVAPPPSPLHDMAALEASTTRPSLYPHQISSSCATNRDMYAAAAPSETDPQEVICGGRNFRSSFGGHHQRDDIDDDEEAMNVDDETKRGCDEARVIKDESSMEYPNSEECILREKEFAVPGLIVPEFVGPEIPWPDYVLMDEIGMDSTGLLGLDLSCETSGVYASAFDFSAEAIDRDSCTSGVLLEEHHTSKFFGMPYEQAHSPPASQVFQECVLLTEPELDYSLSPHEAGPPPLSPRETTTSSSLLWRLDDTTTTTWDGQSSGSTTDVKPQQSGSSSDASGECTSSQDHEALWSSMDLATLCMVA